MNPSVSLCMIVKNEEKCLKNALLSVKDFADEIIVVDTGSSDKTLAIANLSNAKTFILNWEEDFSQARNFSLKQASQNWIFILDADETVSSKDILKLKELVKQNDKTAYSFVTRNYLKLNTLPGCIMPKGEYEEEKKFFGWIESEKIRLFPNHQNICFENVIHEIVEPSILKQKIKIAKTEIPIHHFGFDKQESFQKEKAQMHLKMLKKQLKISPHNAKCYYDIGFILVAQKEYKEAIPYFKKALAQKTHYKEAYFFLAQSYNFLGEKAEAIKILEKLLILDSNFAEAFYLLGNIFFDLNEMSKAFTCYEKSKELNPSHPEVFFKLGLLFEKIGELAKAKEHLLKAKEVLRNQPRRGK